MTLGLFGMVAWWGGRPWYWGIEDFFWMSNFREFGGLLFTSIIVDSGQSQSPSTVTLTKQGT